MNTKDLETIVLSRSGDWKFDEHVSRIFDTHIRRSIPCYNEIQELIGIMSMGLLPENALVYDLGTATGEVISSIHYANPLKKIKYIGLDKSAHMLKQARIKCAHINNVKFRKAEIESYDFQTADLFVAAFTLQFLRLESRLSLLRSIYEAMTPKGSLILCEKIIYENSEDHNFFIGVHETWKRNHFTKSEIEAKKDSLRNVMLPMSLEENLSLLRDANFTHTNVFFKWGNFVGILALK